MIELKKWEVVEINSEFYTGPAIKLYLYDDFLGMDYNKYFRDQQDFRKYMLGNNVKFDKEKMKSLSK